MARNLGTTRLRLKRRAEDPMQAYDALPAPLRSWLSGAVMPWSPASCRKIWHRAQARGEPLDQVLARLDRAEQKTLSRDSALRPVGADAPPFPTRHVASALQ